MPASRFIRRLTAPVTAIALLAGCAQPATIRPYESEPGPYTARLLVSNDVQEKDGFGIYVMGNAQQCGDAQRLAVGNGETRPKGVLIRAERLSTLSTMIIAPEGRCRSVLSFVPRTGRSYVIHVATEDKRCWSYIFDVTDPDKAFAEPSLRRRDTAAAACLPLANSRAFSSANAPEPPAPGASAPSSPAPGTAK